MSSIVPVAAHGRIGALVGLGVLAAGTWASSTAAGGPAVRAGATPPTIDVLFSPNGGCADRIVEEIDEAQQRIRVQAFFFTSKPIARALVDAKDRGVDVEAIFDKSQEKQRYSRLRVLRRGGVTIRIDDEHATANNKIILIDGKTIITGSYNFTRAAEEKNAENVLIIKDAPEAFARYRDNYKRHREHSRGYSG
ncbi:MAG: phospholipase D family protein [Phycisphaerae bacterium]